MASDPLGYPLSYAASGLPAGLSLDDKTGLISGSLLPAGVGAQVVTLWIDNGYGDTACCHFNWTVDAANLAPVLQNPQDQANLAGSSASLLLDASDPNNDVLTFSATGLPSGLTINTATGLIAGTLTSSASATPYIVTVTASDGSLSDSQTFSWSVKQVLLANPDNME